MKMKFNLRLGLTRLWLVASVIWILVSASFAFPKLENYPKHFATTPDAISESIKQAFAFHTGHMTEAACSEYLKRARGKLLISREAAVCILPNDAKNPFNNFVPVLLDIPSCSGGNGMAGTGDGAVVITNCEFPANADTNPNLVMTAIADAETDYRRTYWGAYVPHAIGWTLGPPIGTWLLGWLLVWIAKGFVLTDAGKK